MPLPEQIVLMVPFQTERRLQGPSLVLVGLHEVFTLTRFPLPLEDAPCSAPHSSPCSTGGGGCIAALINHRLSTSQCINYAGVSGSRVWPWALFLLPSWSTQSCQAPPSLSHAASSAAQSCPWVVDLLRRPPAGLSHDEIATASPQPENQRPAHLLPTELD